MIPVPANRSTELADAVKALRPYFTRAAFFGLCAGILILAPSGYMLEVYDRAVGSRNMMTLGMLTVMVIWAYAVMETLDWARGQMMNHAGIALDKRLGNRVFHAMFTANLRRLPGGSTQTVADFRTLREFLTSPVISALSELPVSVIFLIILFAIDPWIGVVAVVGAIFQMIIAWLNERSTKPPLAEANRMAIGAQQYVDGTLRNAPVVEAMGMQRDIHARWMEKQRKFLMLQSLASERAGTFQALTRFLQLLLSSALLGVGAFLMINGNLAGGGSVMIVASILGGRMLTPITQLIGQWRSVIGVREAWARLQMLLDAVPPKPESMPLPSPHGNLAAEQIVAAAPGNPAVAILKGVAFTLQAGDVLAVVGPSASGKSSLARVLVGLWPTAGGKVRLDGVDVFNWDKSELGPYIGYLPQEVELFEGTIAENIARFGEPDMQKVEAAARRVGVHELIMSMPEGYDTDVGGDGAKLSGGQRQRVGLARAFYGDPVFIVLDEPNSSLDEEGEAALAESIRQMKAQGTTFVLMTHRTSILAVSDKMLVLRDGAQQGFGPRDEVLAALAKAAQQAQSGQKPSPFARLPSARAA